MRALSLFAWVAAIMLHTACAMAEERVFEFENPQLSRSNGDIDLPSVKAAYDLSKAEFSPFDYLCTSFQCVEDGNRRNKDWGSPYYEFSAPYKPIVALKKGDLLRELDRDRNVESTSMLSIDAKTNYSYAFLPDRYVKRFDEAQFRAFSLRSGEYFFRTFTVTVPPVVPRGLAICRSRPGKYGKGIPSSCVLIAIFNQSGSFYRVVIARGQHHSSPYITAAYANLPKPSELDAESSTPSWRLRSPQGLNVSDACFRVWPKALADELARDKALLLDKDWFELKITGNSIRIVGETKERISPTDSSLWETLAADITIEADAQRSFYTTVSLYGYIGKNRPSVRAPPLSFYEHYYEKVMDAVRRSHAEICG